MRTAFLWLFLLFGARMAFADAKVGTGFIISPDGYVLTNNHVISGATAIAVNIPGFGHGNAEVVAADPYKDLAILKLSYNNLRYLPIAESRNIQVLDTVIVLGYPLAGQLGPDITASEGQINALREEGRIPLFQFDASVNAGNSGGPVLNDKGEVVGIVVSKLDAIEVLKETGSIPERTNFAIPIDEARGMVRKAYPLGFTPSARTEQISAQEVVKASKGATVLIYSEVYSELASAPADPSAQNKNARLEDHPDYARVEKSFDEAYHEAIAQANPHQRAIFENEHARWLLEREKLKEDPETYIAYTEQEIRYFAGYYDEP